MFCGRDSTGAMSTSQKVPGRPMFSTGYGGGTMQQAAFLSGFSKTAGFPAVFQWFHCPLT